MTRQARVMPKRAINRRRTDLADIEAQIVMAELPEGTMLGLDKDEDGDVVPENGHLEAHSLAESGWSSTDCLPPMVAIVK